MLHAGIDTARIDKHPDQPRKSKHACFLGRLTSQKGIFDLLDVMERIANADADFHLTLMGNGPERAALASAIKSRKLSNITLKGFVTEEEKFAILKSSEFFLFPSYEEGWGIALAEALYSGCKVVTYELAHYRDIFREFPKYAPLGNSAEFANVVLSNIGPPASEEQRSFIRQYDDKNVVQQFDATLKRLVTESSART